VLATRLCTFDFCSFFEDPRPDLTAVAALEVRLLRVRRTDLFSPSAAGGPVLPSRWPPERIRAWRARFFRTVCLFVETALRLEWGLRREIEVEALPLLAFFPRFLDWILLRELVRRVDRSLLVREDREVFAR